MIHPARFILLVPIALSLALADPLPADDNLVTVDRKYVSREGLRTTQPAQPQPDAVDKTVEVVSKFAGFGKEVGVATHDALNAVVDVSDKFSKTDVGHFVLFMVAFKILGKELIAIGIGMPIFLAGMVLWYYLVRRFFFTYKVLASYDENTKIRTYKAVRHEFGTLDGRSWTGVAMGFAALIWCVAWMAIIFGGG